MDNTITLENVIDYFEKEYQDAKELLLKEEKPDWVNPKEIITNTCQRCLGVTRFSKDIKTVIWYNYYRDKLYKLLEKSIDKDNSK